MSVTLPKPGAFYNVGYADPRSIYAETWTHRRPYGGVFNERGLPFMKTKVDAHKYKTEAKDMSVEACKSFWLIKYGNEPVMASTLLEQDNLTWEIGNRLYWANELEHTEDRDTYTCKS